MPGHCKARIPVNCLTVVFSDKKCTNVIARVSPARHASEWCIKNPNHRLPFRKNSFVVSFLPVAFVVS